MLPRRAPGAAGMLASTVRVAEERADATERAHSARDAHAAMTARSGTEPASWRAELADKELLQAEVQSLERAYADCYESLRRERMARELIVQRAVSAARGWAVRAKAIAAGDDPEGPDFYSRQPADQGERGDKPVRQEAPDGTSSGNEMRLSMVADARAASASLFEFGAFAQAGALAQARSMSCSNAAEGVGSEAAAAAMGGCVAQEATRRGGAGLHEHGWLGGSVQRVAAGQVDGADGSCDGWEACTRALQASVEALEMELAARPSALEYVAALDRAELAEAALADAPAVQAAAHALRQTAAPAASTRRGWDTEWEAATAAVPSHRTHRGAIFRGPQHDPGEVILDLSAALGVSSPAQLRPAVDALLARTASTPFLERFVAQVLRILASAGDDPTRSPALALAELSRWAAERPELARLQAYVADALSGQLMHDTASLGGSRLSGAQPAWREAGSARWRRGAGSWGGSRALEAKAARVQASLVEWLSSDL